jgi:large subunit ribosomal protein L22
MEVRAIAKYVRVQPRKVRIIADEVRGKSALYTASLLRYHPSKSARALRKVLMSAVANAAENHGLAPEGLQIATIMIDEGPRLKRIQPRAMGRANRIIKKTSHITVVVEEAEPTPKVKPHGTKAKPRPTFSAPGKGKKGGAKAAPAQETAGVPAAETQPEETTDTKVEEIQAAAPEAAMPEEAQPVTAAEAPEEAGSAEGEAEKDDETKPEAGTGEAEASDEEKGAQ